MDPGTCPHCGGANPYQAINCQWCGAALLPNIPPPVQPIGYRPGEPTPDLEEDEEESPDSRWSNPWLYYRITMFIILLVIFVATISVNPGTTTTSTTTNFPPPTSGPVNVTRVNVTSPDNACGLNWMGAGGYHGAAFVQHTMFWWLPEPSGSTPCTVSNVSTPDPGWYLESSLPSTVTGSQTPIYVTAVAPASFNGTLDLVFM